MYRRKFALPFIVCIIAGTILPIGLVAFYGLTDRSGAFTFENFVAIFADEHFKALILSLVMSTSSTVICLIIAIPLCLILKNSNMSSRSFIAFVFILPMWMNFLLRTMAWQVILERNGLINVMLEAVGFPELRIINTPTAVVLGMVYDFLPFMIMPIYNSMIKIRTDVIEAAYDLGANDLKVVSSVIIPLSLPGIASGITMVFVPSLTTFAISNMLGGGKIHLIGNIIEQEFTVSSNWNLGSGLSLIMMIFIVVSMALLSKIGDESEGRVV